MPRTPPHPPPSSPHSSPPISITGITAGSFEQEAIEASNLYTTALSIHDKASPDALNKVIKKQHTDLNKEKRILEKEIKDLRQAASAYDRDFLDTVPEADTTAFAASITLQDSALSIFIFSWGLFCVLLTAFAFMPPAGDLKKGGTVFVGLSVASLAIWSLIYYYA